jgi:DNA repair photolyase
MNHITLTKPTEKMNGKAVYERKAKTILNKNAEAFQEKKLCDGLIVNQGDACAYTCGYCYVEDGMKKMLAAPLKLIEKSHSEVVIRRSDAIGVLTNQLINKKGQDRFADPNDTRIVYCSSTVDCAANLRLAVETVQIAKLIFEHTNWQLRLLSKSTHLEFVVDQIPKVHHPRLLLGVSTGTLDDTLAATIEKGTPLVSKRLESLYRLQDRGLRTFGMICPSLPQSNYLKFAVDMAAALRIEKCEHIWAEVINVRGKSFTRTVDALLAAGLTTEAEDLRLVCGRSSRPVWEAYARATFEAHAAVIPAAKLRFLQYVTKETAPWWAARVAQGAVLLGKHARL